MRRVTGESLGTFFRKNVAQPLDADFHIGLAAENDSRTSDMYSVHIGNKPAAINRGLSYPELSAAGPLADFARRMQDATTMQWGAFLNPPQDRDAVNTRAWRAAEIPAVNGHGTARALARIYGALARGGEIDGVRILQPQTVARATTEEVSGPERLFCGGVPMRFGLGFVLGIDAQTLRSLRAVANPRRKCYSFSRTHSGARASFPDKVAVPGAACWDAPREIDMLLDGKSLGLALSGGGYRAALFGLGSLWRLNDVGLLGRIDRVTSVSGGSIVAGILAHRWRNLQFTEGRAANFVTEIAAPVQEFCSHTIDIGAGLSGILNPFRSAGEYLTDCYSKRLFGETSMQDLPVAAQGNPKFIFYATNLQTCRSFRFR